MTTPIPAGSTVRQNADGSWQYRTLSDRIALAVCPWQRSGATPCPAAGRPGGADPITQRGTMIEPKPRTDAAQKVYEAAHEAWVTKDDPEHIAAATIRALVTNHGTKTMGGSIILNGDAVLAIATELEGHHG